MLKFFAKKESKKEKRKEFKSDGYFELTSSEKFVESSKIFSTALIENNISHRSPQVLEIKRKYVSAIESKKELVFQKFVVTWKKSIRYGDQLIPTLQDAESSNVEAANFYSSPNEEVDRFLFSFNEIINNLVFDKGKYVEVFSGLIIFLSKETNKLKVIFNKNLVSEN